MKIILAIILLSTNVAFAKSASEEESKVKSGTKLLSNQDDFVIKEPQVIYGMKEPYTHSC